VKSVIRDWAVEAVGRVASGSDPFVSNHLDELLADYSPSRGIETADEAFALLTKALADLGTNHVVGRLVIPLGWTTELVIDPPALSAHPCPLA